jgi:GTP cyclohydrolase I
MKELTNKKMENSMIAEPTGKILSSKVLPDCQLEWDNRGIPIERVGIKNLRYPIVIADADLGQQATVALFEMAVFLPAHQRGTHMSRFIEVISSHVGVFDLPIMCQLTEALASRLDSTCAFLKAEFPFFITKDAPVSGMKAAVEYGASFTCELQHGNMRRSISVKVPVATLCPCSKAISSFGAHNQRGIVSLDVEIGSPLSLHVLVKVVEDASSSPLYSLLKRTDEKYVTEAAYENPVFVEDLVRNIAGELNKNVAIKSFRLEAENFESIHNHSAYAIVAGSGAKNSSLYFQG